MQDVLLNCRANPPRRIGGEAEAASGVETLDRLHHADIAFRDELGERQAIAAIAHGDLGDEPQMAGDQAMRCLGVLMFLPALGEHELLVLSEHRKLADLLEIPREIALGGDARNACDSCHGLSLPRPRWIGGCNMTAENAVLMARLY